MLRFETTLAGRHLRAGGGQTLLTISTVATGVIVIIFISSLVLGLQSHISDLLTDLLPQVTVLPLETEPTPLERLPGRGENNATLRIERQTQQLKNIEDWRKVETAIRAIPGVRSVAPAILDQGFVSRGGKRLGTQIYGADPERLDAIINVNKNIIAGRYFGLGATEVVITYKLAKELRVSMGDRVRITSNQGRSDSFQIVGLYDTGQDEDTYKAYITLRAAQSLYGTGTAVSSVLVRADNLYLADTVADRIAARLPYTAKSWSRLYPQFASSMGIYNAVAFLVSGFSLIAASFAIASVLIVSVLQKSKQIGILKSMGAKQHQIRRVFLLEGLGIALVGSVLGALLGCGLVTALGVFKQPVSRIGAIPQRMFPAQLSWWLVAAAILAAILATIIAAILPARRAAGLNPVEVMR